MSTAARIEELQRKFDENPRRYFAPLANECRKAGDLDAAIAICRAHLPQQPGHMSGHIVYGQALYESGELAEARTVFETALSLDPENLIALRHLGDIASRTGDVGAARQWYGRVLDTDPRNEEIQALVAALPSDGPPVSDAFDASGSSSEASPAAGDTATIEGLPMAMDPALMAAAVDASADDAQDLVIGDAGGSGGVDPTRDESTDDLLDFAPTSLGGTGSGTGPADAPTQAGASAQPGYMATSGADDEATMRDARASSAFSLDGFEATSFDAPPSTTPARADDPHGTGSVPSLDDAPPPQLGERAPALHFDEFESTALVESVAVTPADVAPGLEPHDADGPSVDDVPVADTLAAPTFEHEPADAGPLQVGATEASAPDAFVTETMAELYLQQGYRDRALDVYRQLIAQHPDDTGLRDRMARVETHATGVAADAFATEDVDDVAAAGGSTAPGFDRAERVPAREASAADSDGLEVGDLDMGEVDTGHGASGVLPGLPDAMDPALIDAAGDAAGDDAVPTPLPAAHAPPSDAGPDATGAVNGWADPAPSAPQPGALEALDVADGYHAEEAAPGAGGNHGALAAGGGVEQGAALQAYEPAGMTIREFLAGLTQTAAAAVRESATQTAYEIPDDEVPAIGGYRSPEVSPSSGPSDVESPSAAASPWSEVEAPPPAARQFADAGTVPEVAGVHAPVHEPEVAPAAVAAGASALDQLFGSGGYAEDIHAADTLSSAFAADEPVPAAGQSPVADPLAGRPARPAASELSLDHVFGQPRPSAPGRSTGSFSFDQFFADGAVRAPRDDAPDGNAAKPGGEDDIEQFNAWLQGLKKQ